MAASAQDVSTTAEIALAELIHPIPQRDFFRQFYGKSPLYRSDSPNNALPVFTLDDLIARIQCLELEFGTDFSLARNGEWLSPIFQASPTCPTGFDVVLKRKLQMTLPRNLRKE